MLSDADWQSKLQNLFGGYVNQGTMEDAAKHMAGLAAGDEEAHNYWLSLFKKAKELLAEEASTVISAINCSGYLADSFEDADEIVNEFEEEYLEAYGLNRL